MTWKAFGAQSLKTRITLATLAIFLIVFWSLSLFAIQILRVGMLQQLSDQERSIVSLLAEDVDHELEHRFSSLKEAAGKITPEMFAEPERLQAFLEQYPIIQSFFNAGLTVFGPDGEAIAEVPLAGGRIGMNYLDRDDLAAALHQGQATIGAPHRARKSGNPEFAMSVPIRDRQEAVIGALRGEVNLTAHNSVDVVTRNTFGKSGGYLLIDAKNRLIVTATDKQRVMEQLPLPGANPALDQVFASDNAATVALDPQGAEVLVAAKRIPLAGWYMVATLPTEEAFEPIDNMQRKMLLATVLLTLLAGGLTWRMLQSQFAPMVLAVDALAARAATSAPAEALPVMRRDEIGQLIEGFNTLLASLARREAALQESEDRFKALHEAAFGGIFIHVDRIIVECNQGLSILSGYSREELIGMDGLQLVAPKWRPLVQQNVREGVEKPYEIEGIRKDGSLYQLGVRGRNISYQGREARATDFRDISERKLAEAELDRYRHDLEALVHERTADLHAAHKELLNIQFAMDNVGIGIRRLDAKTGCIRYANRVAAEMLGYTVDEMLALGADDLDLRFDTSEFNRIGTILRREGQLQFESVNRAKDGRLIPVEVLLYYHAGSADADPYTMTFVTDITERQRAEAHLRQLSQAVEQSLAGIAIFDAARVIQYVNPAFTRTSGYAAEEVIGRTPGFMRSAMHDDAFYDNLWRTAAQKDVWTGELASQQPDGKPYWVQASISPILSEGGEKREILGYVGVMDDITEEKATRMQLLESEARFRQAFVHAPFGIAVIASDGRVSEANPALCRMLGWTEAEIKGALLHHFFRENPGAQKEIIRDPRADVETTSASGERVCVHKAGHCFPVFCTVSPVCGADREPLNFIAQIEDISERKQAQLQDLASGVLAAQESERARLSHELHDEIGQSLTALKITLKRAKQNAGDEARLGACLGDGEQMLEQLMQEVRRIAYGLRPSEIDQLGLVAALRSHLDKAIRPLGQHVTLVENLGDRRLPPTLELCCFRVVQESLTNALRHAKASHLTVSLEIDSSQLTLAVQDDGLGFDLSRYHSTHEGASSLGLIGMRERVAANGGQLQIRSATGHGTTIKAVFESVMES